ncbi:MAG: ArsR family transcriptional regulator [Bilophila sp.]
MDKTFITLQAENRRCAFLRFLAEDPDYALNTSLLQSALEAIGHGVSRDQVNTDAAWLEEQGLVSREDLGGIVVVTLTQRGSDVAAGRATVPGVKRPGPRL